MAANRQLGITFTSILNMILYRADKRQHINNSKSEEKDEIYLPTLAGEYIKLLKEIKDPKQTWNAKWFMLRMLEIVIDDNSLTGKPIHRKAPIDLLKIHIFLQAWEEAPFPGMITIDQNDRIYNKYRTILKRFGLVGTFTCNGGLHLGNTTIMAIIQELKKTGGKRKTRKQRKQRKQRKTRKN